MPVYEDEYDDYDDYEDEGDDQVQEGDEEAYQQLPSAESEEYLELRKLIKEKIRKKRQKESGSGVLKPQETKKKSVSDFGTFFGPSQPVIAPRVIQESKSLLENPHLIFKSPNPHNNKKTSSSNGTVPKNGTHGQIPKARIELKSKVQIRKDTRDYSFLLSDDTELPAASKTHVSQTSASRSARTEILQKSKQTSGNSARDIRYGREEGKPIPMNGQMHSKSGSYRPASMSTHSSTSVDSRGKFQNSSASGPGRPVSSMDSRRQVQSKNAIRPARPVQSMDSRRQSQSNNGSGPGRPVLSIDRRRQHESNGIGHGRPNGGSKSGPSQAPHTTVEKKTPPSGRTAIQPTAHRPPLYKTQSSGPNQGVERKRLLQEQNKILSKQLVPPPRPQISKRPPMKKVSRPFEDEDEDKEALRMLRQMFKSDRYRNQVDDDDDLSDMEAGFDDILEEEERSAKIARKEDAEQLRLIEEEEKRDRTRRLAKKRKLSHH